MVVVMLVCVCVCMFFVKKIKGVFIFSKILKCLNSVHIIFFPFYFFNIFNNTNNYYCRYVRQSGLLFSLSFLCLYLKSKMVTKQTWKLPV